MKIGRRDGCKVKKGMTAGWIDRLQGGTDTVEQGHMAKNCGTSNRRAYSANEGWHK